jgi:hypothetical protein
VPSLFHVLLPDNEKSVDRVKHTAAGPIAEAGVASAEGPIVGRRRAA